MYLPFLASRGRLHSLAQGPLPQTSKPATQHLSDPVSILAFFSLSLLLPSFTFKDAFDDTGSTQIIQINLLS